MFLCSMDVFSVEFTEAPRLLFTVVMDSEMVCLSD